MQPANQPSSKEEESRKSPLVLWVVSPPCLFLMEPADGWKRAEPWGLHLCVVAQCNNSVWLESLALRSQAYISQPSNGSVSQTHICCRSFPGWNENIGSSTYFDSLPWPEAPPSSNAGSLNHRESIREIWKIYKDMMALIARKMRFKQLHKWTLQSFKKSSCWKHVKHPSESQMGATMSRYQS